MYIIKDMLKEGVIRKLSSPYYSPILTVSKKNCSIRFGVDDKKRSKVTKICWFNGQTLNFDENVFIKKQKWETALSCLEVHGIPWN